MQTGSFSLQAAAGCTCRPSTFFFLTPVTGNPRDDRPSYLSICGIGDEGDSSKFPSPPLSLPPSASRAAPARLTKYYNDGRLNALVCRGCLQRAACVFRENDAPGVRASGRARVCMCVYVRVCARVCVCVCLHRLSGYAENELVDG